MQLTPAAFVTKWAARFANNDDFLITEGDLREFAQDIADTFGVTIPTVPSYVPGTTYAKDYLVRYTPAGGQEAFYYSLKAGVLAAPGPGNLTEWQVVPGPVKATDLWQPIALVQAQGIDGVSVQAGRLYQIDMGLNSAGKQQLVYLMGLENYFDTTRGVLEVDGTRTAVEHIDLNAGTWQVAGTGAAISLAGTAAGKPVTGDVVLDDNVAIEFTSGGGNFRFYGDGGQVSIESVATGHVVALINEAGLELRDTSLKITALGANPVTGELTIDANGELLVNGNAVSYTNKQARAAQLNRVAPAGTTTVTLTSESDTHYGRLSSGTLNVDNTNCAVGQEATFTLLAGASAPTFGPNLQDYQFEGATYASGQAFSYTLHVDVDRVIVVILPA